MAFDTDTLGQALIGQGLLNDDKLQEALDEMTRTGNPLETVLVDMEFLSHEQIHAAIAAAFGMPLVTLSSMKIPEDVLDLVAPSAAELHKIVPCERKPDGSVVVAVADLENLSALDDLRYILGTDVTGALTTEEEIEKVLENYYRKKSESLDELIENMKGIKPEEIAAEEETGAVSASHAPVVKLLELVLVQAIRDRASDIHFEPFEDVFRIRYRVDGALIELVPPPKHLAPALTSRIKVMAGLKIAERRLPQDGRIAVKIAGRLVDLRVSTLPTVFGESVVVRVLDRESVKLDLTKLGLEADLQDQIEELIFRPNGIIIVTGPTGCGKTTTLYACLQRINTIDAKCITTEDPVEYDIEGVTQVPINESIGLTFGRCLRSILRQDPDRIMVGEIRDLDTTQISIQASLTGHLVLTTLHTNDAATSVTRLVDMGTEPFLLSSTLEAVIAQRLVRRICDRCKEQYQPAEEDLLRLTKDPSSLKDIKFFRGKGCAHCHNSGYHGRVGIFEMLRVTDAVRELINDRAPAVALREKAREQGMRLLREDGIQKINRGETTIDEVVRNTLNL
ncbi:type II/IV secretion system protein [bacterium]|nr:type II/IV secretion system protein [bacterium]